MSLFGLGGAGAVERIGVELVAKTGKFFQQVDGAVGKAEGKFSGLAKNVGKAMVMAGAAGGAALAGVGAAAVKMGLDFEGSIAEVKTLLPDLSDEGFNKLKGDVLDLSKEMGIATSDMVPALYQAISAGVPPENVIDFLRTGAKASIGGVTDLATAVDGLSTVVNAFGLDASETGHVADVMFTAVKLGKTTMAELSQSMFQAAPLAASLGLKIEDVAGATATLTKSGTPTSVAMTQIRQAMVALSKPTADMVPLLAATGYESGEALLQAEGFAGALQLLTDAAGGNTEVLGKAFGSVEALQAVLGLTGENAEVAAADLAAMNDATGAADQAFETMSDTLKFKINKAINTAKIEMTKFGVKVLPLVERGLVWVGDALKVASDLLGIFIGVLTADPKKIRESFDALPESIKPVGEAVMDIARFVRFDLIPAIKTLGKIAKEAFEIALGVAGPFMKFLFKHKGTLKSVALAVLTLVAAMKAYKVASRLVILANQAMKMSIRGLMGATGIGLAIIALTLLIEHWDKIQPIIQKVVDFLKGLNWSEIWGAIVSAFETVLQFFEDLPQTIQDGVVDAIDTVKQFLFDHWKEALILILIGPVGLLFYLFRDAIKDFVLEWGKKAVDLVVDGFKSHWKEALILILTGPLGLIIYLFRDAIKDFVLEWGKKALDLVLEPIKSHWKEILLLILTGPIGLIVYVFRDAIKTALSDVFRGVGGVIEAAAGLATEAVDAIIGAFLGIPGLLGGMAYSMWLAARALGLEIKKGLAAAFGDVTDLGRAIANGIIDILNFALNRINVWLPDYIPIPFFPDIELPPNPLPTIPPLAAGGPLAAGQWAQVNERGIEFFRPFSSGTVMPIAPATVGAGGSETKITVDVTAPQNTARDIERSLRRVVFGMEVG